MSALLYCKYLGWQLAVSLALVIAGFGIDGRDGAFSAVVGSGIAILPNAYFTFQAFRVKANRDPAKAVGFLYLGEIGKLVLVIVLCALAFRFFEFHKPLLLFMALIVMLMTQTIVSVRVLSASENSITDAVKQNEKEID